MNLTWHFPNTYKIFKLIKECDLKGVNPELHRARTTLEQVISVNFSIWLIFLLFLKSRQRLSWSNYLKKKYICITKKLAGLFQSGSCSLGLTYLTTDCTSPDRCRNFFYLGTNWGVYCLDVFFKFQHFNTSNLLLPYILVNLFPVLQKSCSSKSSMYFKNLVLTSKSKTSTLVCVLKI